MIATASQPSPIGIAPKIASATPLNFKPRA